jgi:predicted transporter
MSVVPSVRNGGSRMAKMASRTLALMGIWLALLILGITRKVSMGFAKN